MGALKVIGKSLMVTAVVVLAACGGKEKKMENEGNGLINSTNATRGELAAKQGIILRPIGDSATNWEPDFLAYAEQFDWSQLPKSELPAIRARLQKHASELGRVAEIARDKSMKANFNPVEYEREFRVAMRYLASLTAFEQGGGVIKSDEDDGGRKNSRSSSRDGAKKNKKSFR